MNWKFWKKEDGTGIPSQEKTLKMQGPKDIPESVGRELIVKLGKDPDWVWHLKSVARQRQGEKDAYDVRVFDAQKASSIKIAVANFTSLDTHPELILFEGWYNKKTRAVHVEEKMHSQAKAA